MLENLKVQIMPCILVRYKGEVLLKWLNLETKLEDPFHSLQRKI